MPTRSPRIDGVDCLWVGHFDLSVSLGIPGEFDHPQVQERDRGRRRRDAEAQQGARPPRADCRAGHRDLCARASISSAIPATSGCSTTRCAEAIGKLRDRLQDQGQVRAAMADRFRVALSGDFRKADGSPTYPGFRPRAAAGRARMSRWSSSTPQTPSSADQLEDFDALILLAHRFATESVPPRAAGSPSSPASASATTPSMSRPAPMPASPLVITPDGVRRPVAVSIITLMLALTGKL